MDLLAVLPATVLTLLAPCNSPKLREARDYVRPSRSSGPGSEANYLRAVRRLSKALGALDARSECRSEIADAYVYLGVAYYSLGFSDGTRRTVCPSPCPPIDRSDFVDLKRRAARSAFETALRLDREAAARAADELRLDKAIQVLFDELASAIDLEERANEEKARKSREAATDAERQRADERSREATERSQEIVRQAEASAQIEHQNVDRQIKAISERAEADIRAERQRADERVKKAIEDAKAMEHQAHDSNGLLLSAGITLPANTVAAPDGRSHALTPFPYVFGGYHHATVALGIVETAGISATLPGVGLVTGPAIRISLDELVGVRCRPRFGVLFMYGWRLRTGRSDREPDSPHVWAVGFDVSIHPGFRKRSRSKVNQ
jgi:hypothetical protein